MAMCAWNRAPPSTRPKTVNGEIVIEDDAKVGTVSTVNGSLEIGEGERGRRARHRR